MKPSNNIPIIHMRDVSFQYNSQAEPTLKDINIDIYKGEKVLILGPSGSGKSTWAHLINGLIPHSYKGELKGEVEINGNNLHASSVFELSNSVGTVLQDTDGQFIGLTVAEDIAFLLENNCTDVDTIKQSVSDWCKTVRIDNLQEHRPQDLSGGQKQRVSMAGVLINEAPILLFDEPLANLDPYSGKNTIELIDELHNSGNFTLLIIEHRLEDVLFRDVDRIIVFNDGKIVSDTSSDELLKSKLLVNIGIREPLYVNAMRYAGVDLDKIRNISRVDKIEVLEYKDTIQQWSNAICSKESLHAKEQLLDIKHMNYTYSDSSRYVINDMTLSIAKGEMVSIVGENGAGKSTLSNLICGFLFPTKGSIMWKNEDMLKMSIKERAELVGYVMQNPNRMISKHMIYDEVALGLSLRGYEEDYIREKVYDTLRICGLYEFRNWPISALSFGQKKRVTIAAILSLNPQMIILDEPTAGQDFYHYTLMMDFLEKINNEDIAIIMITHDMHLMLEYTSRAIVMANGSIIADDKPAIVLTNADLISKASLKETSLYTFANQIGLNSPYQFTEAFLSYDRKVRRFE